MERNAAYRCWLVDPRQILAGDGLLDILDSWTAVERWWNNPKRNRDEYLVGYISYEQAVLWQNPPRHSVVRQPRRVAALLPAVWFARYQRLQASPVRALPLNASSFRRLQLHGATSSKRYRAMVRRAQRHIAIGDIYQVNLAQRLRFIAPAEPDQLFWQVFNTQPVPYAALLQTPQWSILSHSPELALRIAPDRSIETWPMKGTAPRGHTPASDHKLLQALRTSAKERAELDMIIDVHRNDLHRICQTGSVKVLRRREAVTLNTVWQMQSRIKGKLQASVSPLTALQTLLPAGSVTGAPKLRATEIIRQLELHDRQVYCGAIGYISGRGAAQFNVAIRTSVLQNHRLTYYSGGGITRYAQAKAEWQEIITKAQTLL